MNTMENDHQRKEVVSGLVKRLGKDIRKKAFSLASAGGLGLSSLFYSGCETQEFHTRWDCITSSERGKALRT